jgi:hypothetical protein
MASTCPSCGRANDDDARYCAGCGAELTRQCSSCGAPLAAGAVFCPSCGALVGKATASAKATDERTPAGADETRVEPRPAGARAAAGAAAAVPPSGATPVPAEVGHAPPPVVPPGPGGRVAGGPPPGPAGPAPGPGGPPPLVPPPPSILAGSGGDGRGRRVPVWLIVVIIVLVFAAAAAAAIVFLVPAEKTTVEPSTSPSTVASASPSGSASASPTPSPSTSAAAGFPMAAASGAKANILSTVSADGTVTLLTETLGAQVFQLLWSPDGRRLACVAGDWNDSRLWLSDVTSGDVTEVVITTPAVVAVDSIAWLSATELLVAGYTVKPASQGEVAEFLVYDVEAEAVQGPLEDGGGTALRGVSVSASGDGGRIAYATYTDQKTNKYGMATATERLELFDRASGAVTELGSDKAFFEVNARRFDDPLISPDGEAIIYRAAGSDVGTSYTVVDTNGSVLMPTRELTYPAGYAWDPTGQKVVFTGHSIRWNGSGQDPVVFYVFDRTVGGKAKAITRYKKTNVQDLSWSPDGATIAFAEYDQKNYETGNIYQLSASGGDAHRLVSEALSPAYRPTGGGAQAIPAP